MKKLLYLYIMLLLLPICLLLFTSTASDTNTLLILGTTLEEDGTLPALLTSRLDTAIEEGDAQTIYIVSGKNEAAAMQHYLIEAGIDPAHILCETRATNTYENIIYSTQLLPTDTTSFTIISNDFHVFRAQAIAHHLGFEAAVKTADTPLLDRFYWQLRESVALGQFWLTALFA